MNHINKYYFLIIILFVCINHTNGNIDSLKNIAKINIGEEKINIIIQISDYYLKGKVDSAIYYLNLSDRLATSLNYTEGIINSSNKLAFAYYIKNDTESAKLYANQALNLSRKNEYNIGIAQSSNILGLIEWRIGSYPNAVDHYLTALNFATIENEKSEIAKSNNYLGLVYWKTGNYPKSISYFFNSLEIKQELNDDYEVALTLNNLSNIHNEIGDFDQAIVFANKALKLSEKLASKYTLGRALGNLGISYLKKNDKTKALEYLNNALKVKSESGEIKGLGYTLIDVGNIYFELNDRNKAGNYYERAQEIMTQINDAHGLSTVLTKLANLHFVERDFSQSITYLNKSNIYAKREGLRENQKENYLLFSQIYEQKNDTKKALGNYRIYSALKDSLVNEKSNSRIKELNINYETNQKERENELLKQNNKIQLLELEKQKQFIIVLSISSLLGIFVIGAVVWRYNYLNKTKKITDEKNKKIEKQKDELKQLNVTKDKFFSILAHDLKNPFQTILGYSSFLSSDYEKLTESEKRSAVEQIVEISKSSYQLLENLLSWANTQTGRIEYLPKNYNLKKITNSALAPTKTQAKRKAQKIDVKINSNFTVYTDINIYSTVLRNLITNAIKFSNIGGKVLIEVQERNHDIIISVEDFGKGIPSKILKEIFRLEASKSTNGTALEKGTGLGLVICKELVDIYNGNIWAESEFGKGSKFYFTVPKNKE